MPQMAPLKWLSLFIIFCITFIMFNTLNYFCFFPLYSNKINNKSFLLNSLLWKW